MLSSSRQQAAERLKQPPEEGLRVSWIGHSTMLIEIEGRRFLTDPIFSDRASPFESLDLKVSSARFEARRASP